MSVEVIGLLYHKLTSQTREVTGPEFDLDYIGKLARAHEASGFDRVLVSQSASMPDPLIIGTYAASITTKLNYMLAHRPGFIAPTMAARIFATIDQISGGRASVHIISGASDTEMLRDGDSLTKEQRYHRSREYCNIMRSLWTTDQPIDHEGEFYRFKQAFCDVKPTNPKGLTISWAGASELAFETAGECADIYAMVGDVPETAEEYAGKATAQAERCGRNIGFSITFCVILGDTEETAWKNAHDTLALIQARIASRKAADWKGGAEKHASVAFQRLLDRSMESDVVAKHIWLGINRATGVAGNNTTIVGTPEQVVETLMIYRALGFTSFLLRGFNPLEDAVSFGQELIPRFRAAIAQYDASNANAPAS